MIYLPNLCDCKVSIIGLGYVGLPLAVELSKFFSSKNFKTKVIGFDINITRIKELNEGSDKTNEVDNNDLLNRENIIFTSNREELIYSDVFVVTVPTPITKANIPDLEPLKNASKLVGSVINNKHLNVKPVIIYESTVFPGATEEVCVPIIEEESNLKLNKDFVCGYSPERINPGDKSRRIKDITKVVSGSNKEGSDWIREFYENIISAGVHQTKSIKIAEAAKIIENIQRDVNIALINELSIIFDLMNIDTLEVLEAANTKWNFLPFKPGLVGGHCIGVDPYYLTYKSQSLGYQPEIVLSGRRINEEMSKWISEKILKKMIKNKITISGSKVLILGFTFKENCPDTRNTKVIDLYNKLVEYEIECTVVDPHVDSKDCYSKYGIEVKNNIEFGKYDVIILLLAHQKFIEINLAQWKQLIDEKSIIFDLKGIVPLSLKPLRI